MSTNPLRCNHPPGCWNGPMCYACAWEFEKAQFARLEAHCLKLTRAYNALRERYEETGTALTYTHNPSPSCAGCRCLILYAGLDQQRFGCMVFGLSQFAEPCPARQEAGENESDNR